MSPLTPRQFSAMARERARLSAAASSRRRHAAWQRIAKCRRLIRLPIAGGSDTPPLSKMIRAALLAGALPRITFRTWAGSAPGTHECACCGLPIRAGEPEYEPQAAPGLYAHLACFPAWHMESARLGPSAAAPGTAAAGG